MDNDRMFNLNTNGTAEGSAHAKPFAFKLGMQTQSRVKSLIGPRSETAERHFNDLIGVSLMPSFIDT
jgi:hypothetical protein